MPKLTAVEALSKTQDSETSENDEEQSNKQAKPNLPGKRTQPERKSKESFLAQKRPRNKKQNEKSDENNVSSQAVEENTKKERVSRKPKQNVVESPRPKRSVIVDETTTSTKTPETGRQKGYQLSPMASADRNRGSSCDSDDSERIPTRAVRKSLNEEFSKLSPEKPKKTTPTLSPQRESAVINGKPGVRFQDDVLRAGEVEEHAVASEIRMTFLNPVEVRNIVTNLEDPGKTHKEHLLQQYRKKFPEWHLKLRLGFNILFHGVGSKKDLLDIFRSEQLDKEAVLVVEGFKPECNVKSIFSNFHTKLLNEPAPKDQQQVIQNIGEYISKNFEHFIFMIHSIDGSSLRSSSAQHLISSFARLKHVHIVASMDHPNLPLLWTEKDRVAFRWIYHHVPTFADYNEFPLADLTKTGVASHNFALGSLQHVFESLTQNAKRIYQEIAKYLLKPEEENTSAQKDDLGMPYKELYKICRASFLVSTEPALRKQLVEFYDHNLLRNRHGPDGVDYLSIPIDKTVLRKFLAPILE